jgi:ribonuclease R
MLFGSYLNQSLWKLSPSFVKPCRIGIFVEVGGEKLSLAEKLVLAILEDHPKGTMNANRVMSRIPREARLNTDIVYKALLRLTHLNKAEQPSKGQFRIKHPAVKITGIIEFVRSGDGFVTPENAGAETKDIFVPSEWLNRSLPGDTVEVDVLGGGNRPTGRVIRVVYRSKRRYTGNLDVFEGSGYLIADKAPFKADIRIEGKVDSELDGMKAIVEVFDYPEKKQNPIGKLIEVLGKPGTNDAEMHAIVAEFGFSVSFPADVEKEAESFSEDIPDQTIRERRDFRQTPTCTIDPADAKDFDDAISYRKLEDGLIELGVHIADVSHFVTEGSRLDQEALQRGTSVYLADRTIPMLPEKLSNNLCSLRPHQDRLAFSAVFTMTENGEVKDRWFGKSIIHSQRRFSYEEAQDRIKTGQGDWAKELGELNTLAEKFQRSRFKAGAISFETDEIRFKLDSQGKPLEVLVKKRFEAHKLIEEFMLLANREVAYYIKTLQKPELPYIYRTHDAPPTDRLIEFSKFCKLFGYRIDISTEANLRASMNKLLKEIEGKPEEDVLQQMALRSMAKAVYTSQKSTHFGLAFDYYTHFTSPIRRYPDLIAHRLLQHYLHKRNAVITADSIEGMAKHSSNMEQKAAEAERASTKYKMAEFLEARVGQYFEAVVSGLTEWGIFAEIIENHCEGMIRLSDIKGDRYEYFESERKVMGRRTRRTFSLGDVITIKVKNANPQTRQIDFQLSEW